MRDELIERVRRKLREKQHELSGLTGSPPPPAPELLPATPPEAIKRLDDFGVEIEQWLADQKAKGLITPEDEEKFDRFWMRGPDRDDPPK
jgi:hypothetical protein